MDERELTEVEARAALAAMWIANKLARRTIDGWLKSEKKPTTDEMMQLLICLRDAGRAILMARDSHDMSHLDRFMSFCERGSNEH